MSIIKDISAKISTNGKKSENPDRAERPQAIGRLEIGS